MNTPQGQAPADTSTASGAADSDDALMAREIYESQEDSLLLCASYLQHSAIYDNLIEMQSCMRAVAERIAALAAPAQPVAWLHDCAALLTNDVELWIDACPHCGKPRNAPQPVERQPVAHVSQETFNDDGTSDIIIPALQIGMALYAAPQPAAQVLDAARVFWQQHTQADALSMTMAELHDDVELVIRAAREAARAAPVDATTWQPIATAPKDGKAILLRSKKGRIADGLWSAANSRTGFWAWAYVHQEPAEWMPKPGSPAARAQEQQP